MQDALAKKLQKAYTDLREALKSDIIGMDEVIRLLTASVFAGGHCLLIGVPGLAKTLVVSSLAKLLDLEFNRIQFTPDLMPSDISGAEIIVEDKETGRRTFQFKKGPLFANLILADEINRTPPKTQAALIEAMEEGTVSSMGRRHALDKPFFVLATQNPIDQEGTYALPAAQLDRFFFNISVGYPEKKDEIAIMRLTTQPRKPVQKSVLTKADVTEIIAAVRSSEAPKDVVAYATQLARATRPCEKDAIDAVKQYVTFGAGPRAAQCMVIGAKANAAMRGDPEPKLADVRELARPVLRHRIVMNFVAASEGMTPDILVDRIIDHVPAADRPKPEPAKTKGPLKKFFAKG